MIGSIYRLSCATSKLFYIGATKFSLKRRFSTHKALYKRDELNPILTKWFDDCGIENIKIELIRAYECVDLKHLHAKETLWINKFGMKNLINQRLSFQCVSNKERYHQYYWKNRDAQVQKAIKYYYDHHEAIRQKYKDDPSAQLVRVKNWIAKNKERHVFLIKRWQKGSFTCECGKELKNGSRYSHHRSKKHIQYLESNIEKHAEIILS